MVAPDGTRYEAFGKYLEVAPPKRLRYKHAWVAPTPSGSSPETLVTVEFHASAGMV